MTRRIVLTCDIVADDSQLWEILGPLIHDDRGLMRLSRQIVRLQRRLLGELDPAASRTYLRLEEAQTARSSSAVGLVARFCFEQGLLVGAAEGGSQAAGVRPAATWKRPATVKRSSRPRRS